MNQKLFAKSNCKLDWSLKLSQFMCYNCSKHFEIIWKD